MSLLYGFKAWTQVDGVLRSMYGEWPARTYTATCDSNKRLGSRRRCKVPPGWECSCGIYTHDDLERTFWYGHAGRDADSVLGLLALSGKVIGHAEGMRSQHAEMVALWAVHNHDALSARYGVEVLSDPFEFQRRCSWLLKSERSRDELSE